MNIRRFADLFADLAARFPADNVNGGAPGDLIEPSGQDGAGGEPMRLAGKVGKNGLGDLLG